MNMQYDKHFCKAVSRVSLSRVPVQAQGPCLRDGFPGKKYLANIQDLRMGAGCGEAHFSRPEEEYVQNTEECRTKKAWAAWE